MTGTDAQVGGRKHHRHRRLADVVLVCHVSALIRRFRQDERNRCRRAGDTPGALDVCA
jgi:hypothetical protein